MKKDLRILPGIFPMPVLMIGTYNEDGSVDVMVAAWGMAQEINRIRLCLSESHKTVKNMERTRACTIALATEELMVQSDYLGIVSRNTVKDKFEKTGFHATKSAKVDAPIIKEYPVCIECQVIDIYKGEVTVEVVGVKVDEKYISSDGVIKFSEMGIISYDPYQNGYYRIGNKVGQAYKEGRKLK